MPSIDYKFLDNENLVEKCIEKDRSAWNEFFLRFTPVIKKNIHSILDNVARRKIIHIEKLPDGTVSCEDEDTEAIYSEIVIKLYTGALGKCKNFADIQPWLVVVTRHHVFDWLDRRNTIKNSPDLYGMLFSVSMDEPIGDSKVKLGDILQITGDQCTDDSPVENNNYERSNKLSNVLSKIEALNKNKSYWVLRLSIAGEVIFDENETVALSEYANRTVAETKSKFKNIMKNLDKKLSQREISLKRAVEVSSELMKLENKLYRADACHSQDAIKALQNTYEKKLKIRDRHIKSSQAKCRPSDKEIADIINMSEKESKHVSVILNRVRKYLGGTINKSSRCSKEANLEI